jgi:hypothetical protein
MLATCMTFTKVPSSRTIPLLRYSEPSLARKSLSATVRAHAIHRIHHCFGDGGNTSISVQYAFGRHPEEQNRSIPRRDQLLLCSHFLREELIVRGPVAPSWSGAGLKAGERLDAVLRIPRGNAPRVGLYHSQNFSPGSTTLAGCSLPTPPWRALPAL